MQTPTPPPELVTIPVAVPVATNVTATQPADSAQDSTPTATANDAAAKKDDDPNNQESVTKADEADTNAITNPATEQEATTGEDTTPKDETPAAPPQLMQSMWRCHQCECTTFVRQQRISCLRCSHGLCHACRPYRENLHQPA